MAVNDAVYKAVLAFEIQKGKIDALRKLLKEENAKLKPLKEEVKKQKDLEKERKKILKEAAANIKNAEKSSKSAKKLEEKSKAKKGKKKKKVPKDVKFKRPRGGTPKSKVSGEKMVWDYKNGAWKEPPKKVELVKA